MDPLTVLLGALGALGINLGALVSGYVRIAERLTRLETHVAILMDRSLHRRITPDAPNSTPDN